ncbi:MAG TPA: VanZ family protein [Gemmataceae bacterium]|nr:VanZ family protein [Gemmataceae bacterium]
MRRPLAILHLLCFLGFLTAWTVVLLRPVPEAPKRVLTDWEAFIVGKSLHVGVYAFLAALGGTLAVLGRRWPWVLSALIVHGALTEYFQQFVGRGASVKDVGLDSIGIALGGLIAWAIRRYANRRPVPLPLASPTQE